MNCPRCAHSENYVTKTRSSVHPDIIYRRRRCLNPDCQATWRTWERLDPRDPCRGRRPGEPRKVMGRPRTRLGPLKGSPPVVKIPTSVASVELGDGQPRSDSEAPSGWREQVSAELKKLAFSRSQSSRDDHKPASTERDDGEKSKQAIEGE